MDVRIGEVVTEMTVSENIGPLGPEELKRVVALVLEQVRREQERHAARDEDVQINNRAYRRGE